MPSREHIERALELIKKPGGEANYVRFFTRLDDSEWIEPLVQAGYFASPPDPLQVGEGVAYPAWPESEYLLRVVNDAPEQVAAVLDDIPLNDNPRVHADLARIAARLPREPALKFAKAELAWLARRHRLSADLPPALAELAIHLAEIGATRRAAELAAELVAVRVVPGSEARWAARVESRMDEWEYRQLVVQLARDLEPTLGVGSIELVGDVLANALTWTSSAPPFDYSQIWRRSIAEDSEVHLDDPRQALITALREVALTHSDEDRERLDAVLAVFARYEWTVFSRLTVDLLAQKAQIATGLAIERTLDRDTLNSIEVGLEYASLLRAVYPTLDNDQRERWLALIADGPTWPDTQTRAEKGISDEQHEGYVGGWQRNWYAQVREHLPREQATELERLEERYGAPQPPAAVGEVKSWSGPTSPLTAAQLTELAPLEIVTFLREWSPSGEPMSPTSEGLGRLVAGRVAAEPNAFADTANALAMLEPTYVRAAIEGFEKATKEERPFAWEPVIELLESVASHASDEPERDDAWDFDVGWRNARGATADLLRAALAAKTLPAELDKRAWSVIDPLTWDEEPTPEYENRYGGSNMDPLTLSLNTMRGKAMQAVFAYAGWRKELAAEEPFSLSEEPAVSENLVAHLDPAREPSVTVRGVFGAGLATLLWLDADWLAEHLSEIFPATAGTERLRGAAWDSYLSYGAHPYHLFPLLEGEYRRTLEGLGEQAEERSKLGRNPSLVLAEHLALFRYNGLIGVEDGGLLDLFIAQSSPQDRAHLVEFLGRALQHAEEEGAPPEAIGRSTSLWEWLVSRTPLAERDVVLAGFGWWYGAAVLDRGWRARELIGLLRAKVPVGPDFILVKTLTQSASDDLDATLEVIYLYVQAERDRWRLVGQEDELRAILSLGAHGDERQRDKTRDIVNLLAAKGHSNLLDLVTQGAAWSNVPADETR